MSINTVLEEVEKVSMKIKLSDLNESGETALFHKYHPEIEDLNYEDQVFIEPIFLKGVARKESTCLFVDGKLQSKVKRECSRCSVSVEQELAESIHLVVDVTDKDSVDLTENIREVLIFQHPIQFLCSSQCKGLCSVCGKNKNKEQCDCSGQIKSTVFEQLKQKYSR